MMDHPSHTLKQSDAASHRSPRLSGVPTQLLRYCATHPITLQSDRSVYSLRNLSKLNQSNSPREDMYSVQSFEQYLPTIERYLLSDAPEEFAKGLPQGSKERQLFDLMAIDDTAKFMEAARRLGFYDSELLWIKKVSKVLLSEAPDSQKLKALKSFKELTNPHFEYERPTAFTTDEKADTFVKGADTLNDEDYSMEAYLKEHNQPHVNICQILTPYGLKHLKPADVQKLNRQAMEVYVNTICLAAMEDGVYPVIKHYYDVNKAPNANFTINNSIYTKLTHHQLEQLPKHIKEVLNDRNYFSSLYRKGWGVVLKELTNLPNRETTRDVLERKRELIGKIRKWLADFKTPLVRSFEDQLVMEALQIDLIIERPDTNLFLEYLKRPKDASVFGREYCNKIQHRTDYSYDTFWHSVHGLEVSRGFSQNKLIEDYLRLIFREKPQHKQAEQFYGYFDKSYVDELYYKVLLARGDTIDNLHTLLSKSEIDRLSTSKELTILESNKRRFNLGEEVVLKLKVKNVKLITAEIYELSTEKHYLSSTSDIDDTVSLDFIEPLTRVTKEVPAGSPYKETTVDFSLAKVLENKPSIYIVDFRGEGVSSRAVIRRGSIVALKKQTLAGVEIKFYQEDSKPIPELDVWCNNKRIHVKEKHVIPFGTTQQNVRLVAVWENFAEVVNVTVPAEEYHLNVSYVYHEESFLVGTKAKVLLQARLFCQGSSVSIKALKESRVTVSLLNHQNISSSFDTAIEWDHKNEFVLEIPVQTYLRNIALKVTAKVDTYAGKPQDLESSQAINFRGAEGDNGFVELFLFRDEDRYKLQLLGKNGEPKPNMNLSLTINSINYNGATTKSLMTNEKGYVALGRLSGVTNINAQTLATSDIQPVNASWRLDRWRNEVQVPENTLYFKVGDELSLPLPSNFDAKVDFEFLKVDENTQEVISDEKAHLRVHHDRLVGKLDRAGSYFLHILKPDAVVRVQVVQAKVWESEGQLHDEKSRKVINCPTNFHQLIGLFVPKIKTGQDGHTVELELNLPSDIPLESVRAHVVSSAFIYTVDQVEDIRKTIPVTSQAITQEFTSKKCNYLSNKELSDEQCYIMNRQNEQKFVGNNLDKPRILLKRIEVRETSFDKEELKTEGDFKAKSSNAELAPASMRMAKRMRADRSVSNTCSLVLQQITTKNNFLKNASAIQPNLHGKVLSFKVPLHHQYFKVILTSQSFAIEKEFGLPQARIPTKDLRHSGLADKDPSKQQAITMSREIYTLQKGQSLKAKRNSLWTVVSSSNIASYSAIKGFKLWDWVMEWPSYSPDKKQKVYDEFVCHQLNVYLRSKDPEFFASVVRPFISNKLEKSIVDYCLLEDVRAVEYARPTQTAGLNALESCLLVEYLVKSKNIELAQAIATSMELKEKGNIVSGELYQRQFDTIVTSKLVQQRQQVTYAPNVYAAMAPMSYSAQPQMCMDMMMQCCAEPMQMRSHNMRMAMAEECEQAADDDIALRNNFKPAFKPVEKTKEYVQTTYYGMKNPNESRNYIPYGKFWADLAGHFINGKGDFLSQNFMYLTTLSEFAFAISFLPGDFTAKFSLQPGDDDVTIVAESSFFVFIKEVKAVEYARKYGILVSQRFFDPSDPYILEEDGTQLEKNVTEFVKDKVYASQTVITNTSVASLDLQVLLDVPQGSIPVESHEYTKIVSDVISSYSIKAYESRFYFPASGDFRTYPSNVSKNSRIVARADQAQPLPVRDRPSQVKLESFNDILRSGTEKDVLQFVREKNIFDNKNFDQSQVYWLLKNRANYEELLSIYRKRNYYDDVVWQFSLYHEDIKTVIETISTQEEGNPLKDQQIFEYFPLSSNRAHKFMNQEKSTILNREFKETYSQFLISLFLGSHVSNNKHILTFAYYLLLQDRVQEAAKMFSRVKKSDDAGFPQLQYDYMSCYLDMYTGYPNFAIARDLSAKHKDHSVPTWRKLFREVYDLLTAHDNQGYVEEPTREHEIKITNKGDHLTVSLPEKGRIELNFHAVNLELLFSQSPFLEMGIFSTVRPFKTQVVASDKGGVEKIEKPKEFHDVYVQPVDLASDKQAQKLEGFMWNSPNVKARVLEDQGIAYVYLEGKAKPGAYCKVYAKDSSQTRFFKDGYTDLQGKFKYITSDIEGIETFAVLFLTEQGGIVKYARKPNSIGTIG